jgi:hypothetical protein
MGQLAPREARLSERLPQATTQRSSHPPFLPVNWFLQRSNHHTRRMPGIALQSSGESCAPS